MDNIRGYFLVAIVYLSIWLLIIVWKLQHLIQTCLQLL